MTTPAKPPMPGLSPRVDVLGMEVSCVDLDAAAARIESWVESDAREYVCVRDVHGVIAATRDPELMEIHHTAGMVTPDGMPLVWCGRFAGAREISRVYGPDLMLRVSEESVKRGWRHFLYGAGEGVAEELGRALQARFPGLVIAGTYSPPYRELTEEEGLEIVEMINATESDIIWVGLSTPKQEKWMGRMRPRLSAPVLVGVGAAFDMHAGRVPQSPRWMQRSGLEWLFRLAVEPRRLWRRYLRTIPAFLIAVSRRPPRLVPEDLGIESSGGSTP